LFEINAADVTIDCGWDGGSDGQAGLGLPVGLVLEVAEADDRARGGGPVRGGPVLGGQMADDLASGGLERGEQVDGALPDVDGAVPDVVVTAPLRGAGIIGRTGAGRCRAWISGLSSTAKTTAPSGGARYRSTTSRILSPSSA
jgi:hypothetical protein